MYLFESPEKHIEHLRLVLQKLREHNFFIKMPKCVWSLKEIEYLGAIVGNGTLRTAPNKIALLRAWPLPEIKKNQFCLALLLLCFANSKISS